MFVHDPLDKSSKHAHRRIYLWNTPDNLRYKRPDNDTLKQSQFETKYRRVFKDREERTYNRESKYARDNWTEPLGLASTKVRSYRKSFAEPESTPESRKETLLALQKEKEERLRKKYGLNEIEEETDKKRDKRNYGKRREDDSEVTLSRAEIRKNREERLRSNAPREHRSDIRRRVRENNEEEARNRESTTERRSRRNNERKDKAEPKEVNYSDEIEDVVTVVQNQGEVSKMKNDIEDIAEQVSQIEVSEKEVAQSEVSDRVPESDEVSLGKEDVQA